MFPYKSGRDRERDRMEKGRKAVDGKRKRRTELGMMGGVKPMTERTAPSSLLS
jgi:hypothetical protein